MKIIALLDCYPSPMVIEFSTICNLSILSTAEDSLGDTDIFIFKLIQAKLELNNQVRSHGNNVSCGRVICADCDSIYGPKV